MTPRRKTIFKVGDPVRLRSEINGHKTILTHLRKNPVDESSTEFWKPHSDSLCGNLSSGEIAWIVTIGPKGWYKVLTNQSLGWILLDKIELAENI